MFVKLRLGGRKMRGLIVVILASLLLVVAGCGDASTNDDTTSEVPALGVDPDEVEETIVVDEGDLGEVDEEIPDEEPSVPEAAIEVVKEFDVVAKKWDFTPDTITVNKGDTVILNIESIDVSHGFSISEFGVNEVLQPGITTRVEFVADEEGTYRFFCTVFCGSGHSTMNGQLIVN